MTCLSSYSVTDYLAFRCLSLSLPFSLLTCASRASNHSLFPCGESPRCCIVHRRCPRSLLFSLFMLRLGEKGLEGALKPVNEHYRMVHEDNVTALQSKGKDVPKYMWLWEELYGDGEKEF
eukprot:g44103.t1